MSQQFVLQANGEPGAYFTFIEYEERNGRDVSLVNWTGNIHQATRYPSEAAAARQVTGLKSFKYNFHEVPYDPV